ncbi:MAG TPA: DinB family protein [Segeticoccus sp.]|uniref:DinB family protein n=1 Tax=Segeticoccus sp. TaxID=2706531 RepID=UPI002D7E36C9|nr:DinB family protein [Segeticoccus sp.]HET8602120.1 DinB family protein [Segeticoccus sp.]
MTTAADGSESVPDTPDLSTMPHVPTRWSKATDVPDMWLDSSDDPREESSSGTDERSVLVDYLRRYRLTLELKCADLDPAQLATRSVPPSSMSLLGLLRHLSDVERHWFRRQMAGQDAPPLYWSDHESDGDFDGAVGDPAVVEDAWQHWRDEVAFAEQFVADSPDLGAVGKGSRVRDTPLRDILVHMIEEYARHCGHADLLRERIDGRVGQ